MDTSKIIKGVVNSGRYTVTAPIVKEDYGLYLQIEGVELPSTYEVDFSNSEHNGTSVTMIGNSDGVLIPSQFISSGKDVFAFLYHVGVDFGRTVYKFRIPNKVRPDRTEETPTPEEQSVIDQAIAALNSAVEQTAQDVIDASASAQNASADAERAETARDTAQTHANNASASATSASESATASANSATASANSASQAEQTKTAVEDMVDDAQGYANSASQSASASAQSASDAQGYAQGASASAQSASGYASSAQGSANTASAKAQDASTSAQTASTKATEASQSASQALTYKTDAESAKTASQTAQGLAESARDTAVQAKDDAESARDEAQNLVDGISGKVEQIDSNTERIESLEDDRYKPYVTDTASGSIASFPDGADGIPLKSLVVDIDPVQDLSNGDPSPENICPISGWTGCEVNATGKNLFDSSQEGYIVSQYRVIDFPIGKKKKCYMALIDRDTSVTLPTDCGVGFVTSEYDGTHGLLTDEYRWIYSARILNNHSNTSGGRANADGTNLLDRILIYPKSVTAWETIRQRWNIAIYSEDGVTVYEPYTGRTIPISWQSEAGTVYGGTLDVLSGMMKVDRLDLDGGDLSWTKVNDYNYGNFFTLPTPLASYATARPTVISSSYKSDSNQSASSTGDSYVWIRSISANNRRIYVKDTSKANMTAEEFKTAMTGVQFVYELATPIEIQLTPHEVNSLLGQNNIWADTGDAEVEYRADTKLYIEKLTQPEEDDMIADSAITSGQFFMIGNSLYRALANIASGATITVGTNAQRVSLSDALNLVNA